jgi:hypothetical protein
MDQYETQIRSIQNQFKITKAQLQAEVTNAELMVAIKSDMNAQEDINYVEVKVAALNLTLSSDTDGSIQAEIDELNGRLPAL